MNSSLTIEPIGAALGAEVSGIDLANLSADQATELRDALLEHQVVGLRDQHLDDAGHVALAEALGVPWVHPMDRLMGESEARPSELRVKSDHQLQTDTWHIDVPYSPQPPAFGILRAVDVPRVGGDTMWANLNLAHDELPEALRARIAGRYTLHDVPDVLLNLKAQLFPDGDHDIWRKVLTGVRQPMIREHPETGRHAIFALGTIPVEGLDESESEALMNELTDHATNLNFTCRWRWRNGDVVIWDERCTAHYAVRDPWEGERVLRRLLVEGDEPVAAK